MPETTTKKELSTKAHEGRRRATKALRSTATGSQGHEGRVDFELPATTEPLQNSGGCGSCYREGSCPPGARASRPHALRSHASAAVFELAPEGRCCRRLRGSTLVRACSMGSRCRSQGDVALVAGRGGPKAPPASPARRSAAASSRLPSNPRLTPGGCHWKILSPGSVVISGRAVKPRLTQVG